MKSLRVNGFVRNVYDRDVVEMYQLLQKILELLLGLILLNKYDEMLKIVGLVQF